MAKLWNNQYYQNPELAGIRKTLGDSMIGSYARDAGDLRGLLNAERTVEQVMRNRTAQNLAGQSGYGNSLMSLMGVPEPDYSAPGRLEAMQAHRSGIDPGTAPGSMLPGGVEQQTFDYDAAALNEIQRRNYEATSSALAGKSAWSQNPNLVSLALQVMGDAAPRRTLLEAQAGQATAAGTASTALARYRGAQSAPLEASSTLIESILGSEAQIKALLNMYSITSTTPEANKVVASLLLRSADQREVASAIRTLRLAPAVEAKLKAETDEAIARAGAADALAGKRRAEAGTADAGDEALLPLDPIKIDVPWSETSFNNFTVEPVLYQSIIPLMRSGSPEDIAQAVASLRRYFEPKKVRYILQKIKDELGGG